MKIRVVEELIDGVELRCPYVVCESCDDTIKAGENGIVIRDLSTGDVRDRAFHNGTRCELPLGPWRSLKEWLGSIQLNSVGED